MSVAPTCACGSRLSASLRYCAVCGAVNPGWTPTREERERQADEELRIAPEGEAIHPSADPLPVARPNAARAAESVRAAYTEQHAPVRTVYEPIILGVVALIYIAICLVAAHA